MFCVGRPPHEPGEAGGWRAEVQGGQGGCLLTPLGRPSPAAPLVPVGLWAVLGVLDFRALCVSASTLPLCEGAGRLGLGPTLMASFQFDHLCEDPISK